MPLQPIPTLHEVRGRNNFCGAVALATLAGLDTDAAAQVIRDVTGRRQAKGVTGPELVSALTMMGLGLDETIDYAAVQPSLVGWARSCEPGTYLVELIMHHFVVVRRTSRLTRVVDCMDRRPVVVSRAVKRRARVQRCWPVLGIERYRARPVDPVVPSQEDEEFEDAFQEDEDALQEAAEAMSAAMLPAAEVPEESLSLYDRVIQSRTEELG